MDSAGSSTLFCLLRDHLQADLAPSPSADTEQSLADASPPAPEQETEKKEEKKEKKEKKKKVRSWPVV